VGGGGAQGREPSAGERAQGGPPLRSRPSSAAPAPRVQSARGLARASSLRGPDPEQMRLLREQCHGLKETANTLSEEKKKLGTRLMALERELQRRDRLLRTMASLTRSGAGLGTDIIDKLREERNLLPVHRKALQGVMAQIQERDEEIRAVKRDEKFTRIIEMQIEYATWQHEARRLSGLLSAPEGELAETEARAHERRVEELQHRVQKEQQKLAEVQGFFQEAKLKQDAAQQDYETTRSRLEQTQGLIRDVANTYSEMLLKRREVDDAEDALNELRVQNERVTEDCDACLSRKQELDAVVATETSNSHLAVSDAVLHGSAMESTAPVGASWALRQALLRGSTSAGGANTCLLAQLRAMGSSGLVPRRDLTMAVQCAATRASPAATEACEALASLLPEEAPGSGVRWLEWLLALDRMGAGTTHSTSMLPGPAAAAPNLPALRPLRAACLKVRCTAEELRTRLSQASSSEQAEHCFKSLGMDLPDINDWVAAWRQHGPHGFLSTLPLHSAAMPKAEQDAWLARCAFAVKKEKDQLHEAFSEAPQGQFSESQFVTCCREFLAAELSLDDVEDLALMSAGADGLVDCTAFLKLWCEAAASGA